MLLCQIEMLCELLMELPSGKLIICWADWIQTLLLFPEAFECKWEDNALPLHSEVSMILLYPLKNVLYKFVCVQMMRIMTNGASAESKNIGQRCTVSIRLKPCILNTISCK